MPTIEELAEAVTEAKRLYLAALSSGEKNVQHLGDAWADAAQAYDDATADDFIDC